MTNYLNLFKFFYSEKLQIGYNKTSVCLVVTKKGRLGDKIYSLKKQTNISLVKRNKTTKYSLFGSKNTEFIDFVVGYS